MDEVNKIRKSFYTKGLNKHQIAKRFNRSWDTVDRIIEMDREELKHRGTHPKRTKKVILPEVVAFIENCLEEEGKKGVKKKQKYTARTMYNNLKEKNIYPGSLRTLQQAVGTLRKRYNLNKQRSFIPLQFSMSDIQIDHGEIDIKVEGVRTKGYLFVAAVPGQQLRYCQAFPKKASEAWGEFHERVFRFFGGIFRRAIYDNDSVLVKSILGKERTQTNFSLSMEEHYNFVSHFCNRAAGHEKGAVENAVGYCRRRFFAGCPSYKSWESVNVFLDSCCRKDIDKGKHYKTQKKLSFLFEETKKELLPLLPQKRWYRWVDCRVDKCQLITIDRHQYSVPEKFVGSYVHVALAVFEIEIFKDKESIALYSRQYEKKNSLRLDHYLAQLLRKPYAFSYCKAVFEHKFNPKLLEIWKRLSKKFGTREGNRQFISILLLQRTCTHEELIKGVGLALKYGAIEQAAVENIIRQLQIPQSISYEEEMKKLFPRESDTYQFDLHCYADLCCEVAR